jgi:hypothetical protein
LLPLATAEFCRLYSLLFISVTRFASVIFFSYLSTASTMTTAEEFASMSMSSLDTLRSHSSRQATVKADGRRVPPPGAGHYTAMDIDALQNLMFSVESEQVFPKRTQEMQQRRVSKLLDFCKQRVHQDRANGIKIEQVL